MRTEKQRRGPQDDSHPQLNPGETVSFRRYFSIPLCFRCMGWATQGRLDSDLGQGLEGDQGN